MRTPIKATLVAVLAFGCADRPTAPVAPNDTAPVDEPTMNSRVVQHVSMGGADLCEAIGLPTGCDAKFSLVANQRADGTVTGQWQDVFAEGSGAIHVRVDCLNVVGNGAVIGGVITNGEVVGTDVTGELALTAVVDNGSSADDSADQLSLSEIGTGPTGLPIEPTSCMERTPADFLLIDLTHGHVKVRSARRVAPGDVVAANLNDGSVAGFNGRTGDFRGYLVPPGTGGLAGATGVTFGPDGDLYVGSLQTNQVLRYDGRTGEFRGPFVDGGELAGPFSLIFGPDGDLYVSSASRNEVLRFDGDTGAFGGIAAADSTLVLPIGLRFGTDGLLYVANAGGESVDRYDPATGGLVDRFATGIPFAADLDFGPDGDLYVSSAAAFAVLRFDGGTGTFADTAVVLPDNGVPVGLAFADDGRLFVNDFVQSRLFVLEPGATEATFLSSEGLAGPENVAVVPGRGH